MYDMTLQDFKNFKVLFNGKTTSLKNQKLDAQKEKILIYEVILLKQFW